MGTLKEVIKLYTNLTQLENVPDSTAAFFNVDDEKDQKPKGDV